MSPAVEEAGWLARFEPAIATAIQALAADVVAPSIVLGALFVPSSNGVVDEGPVPGRADMTYRWARDEADVTFKVLIDREWRTLLVGTQSEANVHLDANGDIIARAVPGAGGRLTLVADVAALDGAAADMRAGAPDASDAATANTSAGSGLINKLLSKYGNTLTDEDYMSKPEWLELVGDSRRCLELFLRNDRKNKRVSV